MNQSLFKFRQACQAGVVIMKRVRQWLCVLVMGLSSIVLAVDTSPGKVTSVKLDITGVDDVATLTLEGFTHVGCSDEITFLYVVDTVSEVHYAMLMTAKSAGLDVIVGYTDNSTSCDLTRVDVVQ